MRKSVLAEIVRSLNKKEIRELHKWLQSPAHNQRQDVVLLFNHLEKSAAKPDNSFEKELAWKALFPKQPYDDAFMRQVMYFLLKAIEEYLVFSELSNDVVNYQLSLTRIYRTRKLDKARKQAIRVGVDHLENQPLRDNYYLRNKFFFEQEFGLLANIVQNASANLQETANALEKWFLAEKLHLSYAMFAHRSVYKTAHYNEGMLEEVLTYCQDNGLLNETAIAVYFYAYQALANPQNEEFFDKMEVLIHSQERSFTYSEFRTLYVAALNYCVAKINQGRVDFARRAFDLYKKGLETGVLLENNTVSRYTFGNAVAFAIKIGEFGWAENFIKSFQVHLDEKERTSIVNFNFSRVLFEKGDYDSAQDMLTRFEYDDMHLNIIAKTMLLKIYYKKDDFDAFESLLESMRTYLQRKEALDPARKTAYKNMISMMKKLLHVNIFSKVQREKFRETIEKTTPLAEREWLLKQLE
jgi:hypothetical protein